jgi:hypothetical protein
MGGELGVTVATKVSSVGASSGRCLDFTSPLGYYSSTSTKMYSVYVVPAPMEGVDARKVFMCDCR